jgi:hypothetical protein
MKSNILKIATTLAVATLTATAAPTADFRVGATSVKPDAGFLAAATSLGVTVAPIDGKTLTFPITAGSIDLATAAGEIVHNNGIVLKAGTTVVELRNFIIDTTAATPVLTGLVVVNEKPVGRLELFDLGLPAGIALPLKPYGFFRSLKLADVSLKLTDDAATALNSVFAVTAFAEGLPIGTACVQAFGLKN